MQGVVDIDRGWKRIMANALEPSNAVLVGIRGEGTGKSDLAQIGLYHERGGKRPGWTNGCPPKRSWLAPVVDENEVKILSMLDQAFALYANRSKIQILRMIGLFMTSAIKRGVRAGIAPPLAESTKKQKRKVGKAKDTPLIFRGRLINSITYWIK